MFVCLSFNSGLDERLESIPQGKADQRAQVDQTFTYFNSVEYWGGMCCSPSSSMSISTSWESLASASAPLVEPSLAAVCGTLPRL